jgi:uncharacterized delta-60 repeat protein
MTLPASSWAKFRGAWLCILRCSIVAFLWTICAASEPLHPGSLDPSFVPGALSLGAQAPYFISAFRDDSILVCDGALRKLRADGSPDVGFPQLPGFCFLGHATDPEGYLVAGRILPENKPTLASELLWLDFDGTIKKEVSLPVPGFPYFAFQPDGKIIVAQPQPSPALYRLNSNGSLDSTFNCDTPSPVIRLVVQSDGKIIGLGFFNPWGTHPRQHIVRLNADGSLDLSYAPGLQFINPQGSPPSDIALQPDDKLLVVGPFTNVFGQTRKYIVRLNPDGTLDSSFDFTPPQALEALNANVSLLPNGKIVLGGTELLFLLSPDGKIESSTRIPSSSVVVRHQGDIITAGGNRLLWRVKSDGAIDPKFHRLSPQVDQVIRDDQGQVWILGAFPNPDDTVYHPFFYGIASLQQDGNYKLFSTTPERYRGEIRGPTRIAAQGAKLLVYGSPGSYLTRLNENGQEDQTFHKTTSYDASLPEGVLCMTLEPDGRILVGGTSTSASGTALARFLPGGLRDTNFQAVIYGTVYSIESTKSGKILVGGEFFKVSGTERHGLVRLNSDGSLDSSFDAENPQGIDAYFTEVPRLVDARIDSAKTLSSGQIVAVGNISKIQGQWVGGGVLLDATGKLLLAFQELESLGTRHLAITPDQRILIATYKTVNFFRLQGLQLPAILFAKTTVSHIAAYGESYTPAPEIRDLILDGAGKVLLGGAFELVDGAESPNMARLLLDFPPPRLNIVRAAEGSLRCIVEGSPSSPYVLEASTDLIHWIAQQPSAHYTGRTEIPLDNRAPEKFLRAALVP